MGTFFGHVLPGSFLITFAVWWIVQTYRRHFRSLRPGATAPFSSSLTFPCDLKFRWLRNVPLDMITLVVLTTVGFITELNPALSYPVPPATSLHHCTTYVMFGVIGVLNLLAHYLPHLLPQGVEYLSCTIAFLGEAVLFSLHTDGHASINPLIHKLLLGSILTCAVLNVAEMSHRDNVIVALAKSWAVLLQGTWLWQAAFLLYNPLPNAVAWNAHDHDEMMLVTMYFTWHLTADFLIVLALGLMVKLVNRLCDVMLPGGEAGDSEAKVMLLPSEEKCNHSNARSGRDGSSVVNVDENDLTDDEDDVTVMVFGKPRGTYT